MHRIYEYQISGLFEKSELNVTVKAYQELNDKILKERKELDDG